MHYYINSVCEILVNIRGVCRPISSSLVFIFNMRIESERVCERETGAHQISRCRPTPAKTETISWREEKHRIYRDLCIYMSKRRQDVNEGGLDGGSGLVKLSLSAAHLSAAAPITHVTNFILKGQTDVDFGNSDFVAHTHYVCRLLSYPLQWGVGGVGVFRTLPKLYQYIIG